MAVWMLNRDAFESKLGKLAELKAEQYLADPRALIGNFYAKGDKSGPAGAVKAKGSSADGGGSEGETSWFVVYRPCSRDSIAKMLGGMGTGKGLNIKGKSAKKNRLSGFVPFCQISKNEDRKQLEASPKDSRFRIFYSSAADCAQARGKMESALAEMKVEKGKKLNIEVPEVRVITEYEKVVPPAFGLDVPEELLMYVYIHQQDCSPVVGWETGRDSEPAFLDMNRHSLRDGVAPPVVLYQFDPKDPMNPLGLLMAYAEAKVLPVVSDFDTFLVGSKGLRYSPTPPEQITLMNWALDHTTNLLETPNTKGWMGRWLDLLKDEARRGFSPMAGQPKFGFGDATSYGLIGDIVEATKACGAVRHGAECFNFGFPQELDPEFLIVWGDGFDSPPWKKVKEPELREFLLERAAEGFSFPLNPVWPVRDKGWMEVLRKLQTVSEEAAANISSWFPPESGVLERIDELHSKYPEGFKLEEVFRKRPVRASFYKNITDCDTRELASYSDLQVYRENKFRWRRIRGSMKMEMMKSVAEGAPMAPEAAGAMEAAAAIKTLKRGKAESVYF